MRTVATIRTWAARTTMLAAVFSRIRILFTSLTREPFAPGVYVGRAPLFSTAKVDIRIALSAIASPGAVEPLTAGNG